MNVSDLVRQAESLGSTPSSRDWKNIASIAARHYRELIASTIDYLGNLEPEEEVSRAAREVATHYVWPLHISTVTRVGVFINEFKDVQSAAETYAASVHNHRYDFVTIVLCGGYTYETYVVQNLDPQRKTADARRASGGALTRGQWGLVERHTYHRLIEVEPNTLTLLVKGAPQDSQSYSVDLETGRLQLHIPVERRIPDLRQRLKVAENEALADASRF